ncbi:MAG TPA: hypothetical protein VHG91_20255 [Longimicrobium sp.]|nr:hypothetical protein [Longimicrobium sp.]
MSDFLSRLAARALGEAPVLRPVVPSRWEGGAGDDASPGFTEVAEERAASPFPPRRRAESRSEPGSGSESGSESLPPRRRPAAPPAFDAAESPSFDPPSPRPAARRRPSTEPGPMEEAPSIVRASNGETPPPASRRAGAEAGREAGLPVEIEEVRAIAPAPRRPRPSPVVTRTTAEAATPDPAVPREIREETAPVPARRTRVEAGAVTEEVVFEEAEEETPARKPVRATTPLRPVVRSVEGAGDERRWTKGDGGSRDGTTSAPAAAVSLPDEAEEARPVVRVTIGRIEVRAAPPPAPQRPAAPAWTPPVMTLEEYLAREGRR